MNSESANQLADAKASDCAIQCLLDSGLTRNTFVQANDDVLQSAAAAYIDSLVRQSASNLLIEAFIEQVPMGTLMEFFQLWAASEDPQVSITTTNTLRKCLCWVGGSYLYKWGERLPSESEMELYRHTDRLIDEAREMA